MLCTKAKGEGNTFRFAGICSKCWTENKVPAQDEKLRDYQGFHQTSIFFGFVFFFSPDTDTNTLAFVSVGSPLIRLFIKLYADIGINLNRNTRSYEHLSKHWLYRNAVKTYVRLTLYCSFPIQCQPIASI